MQAENAASPEPRYWHYYRKCNFNTEVDIHTFYYFKCLRVVACLSEVIFIRESIIINANLHNMPNITHSACELLNHSNLFLLEL